jgi:hypothetical protein
MREWLRLEVRSRALPLEAERRARRPGARDEDRACVLLRSQTVAWMMRNVTKMNARADGRPRTVPVGIREAACRDRVDEDNVDRGFAVFDGLSDPFWSRSSTRVGSAFDGEDRGEREDPRRAAPHGEDNESLAPKDPIN